MPLKKKKKTIAIPFLLATHFWFYWGHNWNFWLPGQRHIEQITFFLWNSLKAQWIRLEFQLSCGYRRLNHWNLMLADKKKSWFTWFLCMLQFINRAQGQTLFFWCALYSLYLFEWVTNARNQLSSSIQFYHFFVCVNGFKCNDSFKCFGFLSDYRDHRITFVRFLKGFCWSDFVNNWLFE